MPDFLNVAANDARMPVYAGDAAMVFEGGWFEGAMLKSDEQPLENFKFFLPPTDHDPGPLLGLPGAVDDPPLASKHKDEAAAFINWITIADTQKGFSDAFQRLGDDRRSSPSSHRCCRAIASGRSC